MKIIALECPYGHDSEFTNVRYEFGANEVRTDITCKTCGRVFRLTEFRWRWVDFEGLENLHTTQQISEVNSRTADTENETVVDAYGYKHIKYWHGKTLRIKQTEG